MKKNLAPYTVGFVVQFPYGKSLKGATMFEISADSTYFGDYLYELAESGIWSDDEDFWSDYDED